VELWARLRHFELTWTGLFLLIAAFVAVLFLRRLLPERRRHRGRLSVLLLGVAPVLHLIATGFGLIGAPSISAALHLLNLCIVVVAATGVLGMIVFDLALGRTAVPTIARDLVQAGIFGGILFVVLRSGGIDPVSALTTSAVLTAVIGLALQNIMANVLAGVALQIDRTLTLGDWIQWGQRVGRIAEINWRSSSIVTREGDTAIVPNATLVSNEVLNLSRPTHARCVIVRVPVHHRHSPGEVRAALLPIFEGVAGVLADPAPVCAPFDFEVSRHLSIVSYGLVFWIDEPERQGAIEGEVRTRVWYAAERAGIEGPCPRPSDDDLEPRLSAIGRVSLLTPVGEPDRRELARSMRRLRFAEGERILRQGDEGSSLFVVDRGAVHVRASDGGSNGGDADGDIATLGPGDFFGEMSLLTGAPRAATCIAAKETVCWEIPSEGFRRIVDERPAIAEEISGLLAARQGALDDRRGAKREPTDLDGDKARLLARVRAYFHLG